MAQVLRRLELRPGTEVDGDQPGNVGNSKVRTAGEFILRESCVESRKEMLNSHTPAFGERLDLLI